MNRNFGVLLLIILLPSVLQGQEQPKVEPAQSRHKVTLELSQTHVPASIDNGGKKVWQVLASWGLNYDFTVSKEWGIGLHTDMVVQNFSYESESGIIKKRTRPVATALVGTRKFGEHLTVFGGGGMELASEGTLGLVRVGLDSGWEMPGNWEFSVSLMGDFKIGAYDAWVLAFGIGKSF